jgi:hypothetical protein
MPGLNPRPAAHGSLRGFHRLWIAEARRVLQPALRAEADFWARWAAVRYLSEDFRERFWIERRLVEQLRPRLPGPVATRLAAQGEKVYSLHLELDRGGRRRGAAPEFAASADALLNGLGRWLGDIERAAAEMPALASATALKTGTDAG